MEDPNLSSSSSELVQEGMSVVLDVNNEKLVFNFARPNQRVKIGSTYCTLAPVIGSKFGSVFEVRNVSGKRAELVLVNLTADVIPSINNNNNNIESNFKMNFPTETKDNRELVDDNSNQKISEQDIKNMRNEGISGKEIIENLIKNSSSFELKTEYSKEKYMKKKQKKYAPKLIVRKPTARLVCEAYFSKAPYKTCFLRLDSLSLVLSLSNVSSFSNTLIFEQTSGMITASVLERMNGNGNILCTYYGSKFPPIDIVKLFNLRKHHGCIARSSLSRLFEVQKKYFKASQEIFANDNEAMIVKKEDKNVNAFSMGDECIERETEEEEEEGKEKERDAKENCGNDDRNMMINENENENENERKRKREENGVEEVEEKEKKQSFEKDDENKKNENKEEENELKGGGEENEEGEEKRKGEGEEKKGEEGKKGEEKNKNDHLSKELGKIISDNELLNFIDEGFHSLIIASPKYSPLSLSKKLLTFLLPSSPFVIYHTHVQPLAEAMHYLQNTGKVVNLQLTEPWLREYQVLPQRTHPQMQMKATGGYLLHGIYISNEKISSL